MNRVAAVTVVHEDPAAESVVAHVLDVAIGVFDLGEQVRQSIPVPGDELSRIGGGESLDFMDFDQATEAVGH